MFTLNYYLQIFNVHSVLQMPKFKPTWQIFTTVFVKLSVDRKFGADICVLHSEHGKIFRR